MSNVSSYFRVQLITVLFVTVPPDDVTVYVPAFSVFRAPSSVSPHTSCVTIVGDVEPVPVQVVVDTHV